MSEEFHDAQEYIPDDKIKEFDINSKIALWNRGPFGYTFRPA